MGEIRHGKVGMLGALGLEWGWASLERRARWGRWARWAVRGGNVGVAQPHGGAEEAAPGDVVLPHHPRREPRPQEAEHDGGDDAEQHLARHLRHCLVQLLRAGDGRVFGHLHQVAEAEVEEVEGPGHQVGEEDEAVAHQLEHLPALLHREHDGTDEDIDVADEGVDGSDDA